MSQLTEYIHICNITESSKQTSEIMSHPILQVKKLKLKEVA